METQNRAALHPSTPGFETARPGDARARQSDSLEISPTDEQLQASGASSEGDGGIIPPAAVGLRITTPNTRHYWKPLIQLLLFWASGMTFSIGHVAYYKQQDGTIVSSPWDQENKSGKSPKLYVSCKSNHTD